jgi:cytochrome c biogenesis protein CcdA
MLALFALGVMSLFWMAVVGTVILVEKLAPAGRQLSRLFAVALVALGVWVASAPGSVPGLVQPNSHGAELARMKMMGGMRPAGDRMQMKPPAMKPMGP